MQARGWLASLALLIAVWPRATRAQESSDWTQLPLTRTTRIAITGSAMFEPGRSWSIGGMFAPFITEHWQVGIAPRYSGNSFLGETATHGIRVGAFANYHIGRNRRFRPFIGGYAEAVGSSMGGGETWYGAQAGWNYFLSPYTALRGEFTYRIRLGEARDYWNNVEFTITLDPFVRGRAARSEYIPASLGTFDIAFTGRAWFAPDRTLGVDAMLAPFLSRWLQVGGAVAYTYVPSTNGFPSTSARTLGGFARLYAPIATRAIPFVGGAIGSRTYSTGGPMLANRGVLGGIRHPLSPGAALDVILSWQRHDLHGPGAMRYRLTDEVMIKAQIVTQVRRGR